MSTRDLAHEADMRALRNEQLRADMADCYGEGFDTCGGNTDFAPTAEELDAWDADIASQYAAYHS